MRIAIAVAVMACLAWSAQAAAQEDERAPTRGLLKRGLLAKGKTTTTTTTQEPEEEVQYDDAEYAEGESQEPSSEAPPSSTEGKKLVGGGVRPFRSNTDLLETLKRRRAQAAEAKLHGYSSTTQAQQDGPTETPVKANFNKKRFNSASRDNNNEDSPAAKPSRNRFGRPAKSFEPEPENDQSEEVAPATPVRTGRTFRRGGN